MSPLEPDQNKHTDDPVHSVTDASFHARLLDAVGQAVIATDPQGKIIYWNRAAEKLYGWSADEVIGRPVVEVISSEDLVDRAEEIMSELKAGRSWSGEFEVRRKDGTTFLAMVTDTLMHDEQGNLVGIIGISTDVTEAKKTEELRRSEEHFRSLVQNASEAITIVDAGGTVRYVSSAIERMLGYRPQERIGRSGFELLHPKDLPRARSTFAEALKSPGVTLTLELRMRHRDGSWRDVGMTGTNLLDDPSVEGIVLNWRDITEHKLVEEALKESENRLQVLFENSLDLISLINPDNTVRYISPSVRQLLGYEPEELEGTLVSDLVHPEDFDRFGRKIVEQIQSGISLSGPIEGRYQHKDGSWRHLETICSVLLDDPNVQGVVCASRDVTKRKQIEREITELNQRNQMVLDSAGEGIIGADREGRITFANPTAAKILGWEAEELIGRHGHPTMHHTKSDGTPYPREECPMHASIKDVIPRGVTHEVLWRKDGTSFFAEYTINPVKRDEEVVGAVLTFSDITDRKQAEEALGKSEALNRAIVDTASDGIITMSEGGLIRSFNRAAEDIFGYNSDEVIGRPLRMLMPERFRVPHEEGFRRYLETGEAHIVGKAPRELAGLRKDGTEFPLELSLGEMREGEDLLFTGVVRDITARKRIEDTLRAREASLAEAQRIASLGSWEWDIATDEVRWSDETYRIFGHTPQSFTPSYDPHYLDIIHPEDRKRIERATSEAFEGKPYSIDYRIVRQDGEVRHVHSHGEVLFDDGGKEPVGMAGTVQDITERKRAEEQLYHQAFHDLLTGLPNRKLFIDRLKQALRRTRRQSRRKKVAVLFMDLDNFKIVNDSLGHEIGDRLLVAAGERIRGSLRPEDTLARFGGDEFTVLVENVEDPADAVRVAERTMEALREPFVLADQELFIKPSIGIALGEARTTSSDELLRDADMAMYRAKKGGLGYQVFEPVMYEQALRRLKVENDLQRAIESEEFVVHYQPIIDLRSDEEVWGMEALVRWQHPERGLLDPKEFVPAAEESGLVIPMGERVLKEACAQAKEWQERYPSIPPWVISVNLSARQVGRPDLARTIERILRETGLEAHSLSLDITETGYIKALEGNTAALDELKRQGVRLSIDDFGMGYSSLSYLKRLPVDALKIDRSFIRGLGEDAEDTVIVKMIIDLAHTLGMEVVAEGIENKGQAVQLKEMGCDLGQGYHFAKRLPPEAIPNFLTR